MSVSYNYPAILINNNKKIYGQLALSEKGVYFSGYSSRFRYLVSTIIDSGGEQTCSASYDQIMPDKISRNDKFIYIQVVNSQKILSLNLKVKSSNEAILIVDKLTELLQTYHRNAEIRNSLRAKYKAGDVEDMHHQEFEKLVTELFTFMGNVVYRVGGSGDGGIDLIGKNKKSGEKIIVQCKRYKNKVGISAIRDFYGALIHSRASIGYFVTTGEFTSGISEWIKDKPIELINGKKLKELLFIYYK